MVAGSFDYSSVGPYLSYAKKSFRTAGRIKLDADGLPMVRYGEEFQYNPVTIAQFGLAKDAQGDISGLKKAADKLIDLQRSDGAFPYYFQFRPYMMTANYAPGWVSGMAQGQALSVLSRGWKKTGDNRYLKAGNAALSFLQVKHPDGPMTTLADLDPALSNYIFFEEYITDPHTYTLNGYMFTLIGLYDWSTITGSKTANRLFKDGIKTLEKILPLYDLGNFSSYDLYYITQPKYLVQVPPHVAARYHKVHLELLSALYSVTHVQLFHEVDSRWRKYVNQAP
ncbi:hypothetical protein BFN67_00935 [Pseudaminobacter manganicus]|uniref:D-glucuronyl C5-epimerase C-terminal domain-containing protein n=2 Tax=Manganibacter manganicus TaxID=1873176 RepID=A0A1V8RW58_9HYPH|nr:hypothetical protein BFN67_00935 [Pseudaminobacter manganicus]